jgi:hypothetical protein
MAPLVDPIGRFASVVAVTVYPLVAGVAAAVEKTAASY